MHDAVIDMWLLGECDTLVGSAGSTFSQAARMRTSQPAVVPPGCAAVSAGGSCFYGWRNFFLQDRGEPDLEDGGTCWTQAAQEALRPHANCSAT